MNSWTTKNGISIILAAGIFYKSYLIHNGERFILVDTGRKKAREQLICNLERAGVRRGNLAAIILTHTHYDHADNAALIKERFKTKIIVHESEAEYLKTGDSPLPAFTFSSLSWLSEIYRKRTGSKFRFEPVSADITVSDRLDLNLLGFDACIIHTPGHTKGSLSVIVDDDIAFTGDNMVGVVEGSLFPPVGDDAEGMIRSWKVLLGTGCSLFIPCHGTPKKREILQRNYDKIIRKRGI